MARPHIWTNGCVVRLDHLRNLRVSVLNRDRYAWLLSFFALVLRYLRRNIWGDGCKPNLGGCPRHLKLNEH